MNGIAPRLAKIVLRDFRAFPGNETYTFDLSAKGNNLLLFGENGSGKSSLFLALRLLLSERVPNNRYEHYRNVFSPSTEGTISVELTSGMPNIFRWDYGESHPAETEGMPFLEFARRSTFLDYRSLLRTSFLHEDALCVDLFQLLVETLLRVARMPDGRTVTEHWEAVQRLKPSEQPSEVLGEDSDLPSPKEQIQGAAEEFMQQLGELLNVSAGGGQSLVALANDLLARLTTDLEIRTETGHIELIEVSTDLDLRPHRFAGAEVRLKATYAGYPIEHPAQFLNEGRLTAIALALYLAAALLTTPRSQIEGLPRILVLDDILLGLDLAHRMPLLELLQGDEFGSWQIFLFTYDASWFSMACDFLPTDSWARMRLHAEALGDGWEMPVLCDYASYLDKAWAHIQSDDYKAAGVYLRSAWEEDMRGFCVRRQLKMPLKNELRAYKAEDLWQQVRSFEYKTGFRLVDDSLAREIRFCQRHVLNPLCHSDPARPTREEVRRAHMALSRLRILLEKESHWTWKLPPRIASAIQDLSGEEETLVDRALRGLARASNFALEQACKLLGAPNPELEAIGILLRSSFEQALWRFCSRNKIDFTIKCCDELRTRQLWQQAVNEQGGLATSQPGFVAFIESHRELLLEEELTLDLLRTHTKAQLEEVCICLRGGSTVDNPKCAMDSW